MDEDGAFTRRSDLQLADKPFPLNGMSSAFVVVIETNFSARDDLGLGKQAV